MLRCDYGAASVRPLYFPENINRQFMHGQTVAVYGLPVFVFMYICLKGMASAHGRECFRTESSLYN